LYVPIVNEDLIELKKWLQFNVEPMSEVTLKWQKTCEIHRDYLFSQNINIVDILDKWPIFKQSFAYNLVIFYFIEFLNYILSSYKCTYILNGLGLYQKYVTSLSFC